MNFYMTDMETIELDLVHQAVFTEPKDQSPWLYYKWLIGGHGKVKPNSSIYYPSWTDLYRKDGLFCLV